MTTGHLLGVDPGPTNTAWCVTHPDGSVGAFMKENNASFCARLKMMSDLGSKWGSAMFSSNADLSGDITQAGFVIELVAIERVQHYGTGMPAGADVFDTCYESGGFAMLCRLAGVPVRWVFRREVKLYLCGSMKARDPHIRQALIDRIGPPGTKKNPGPTAGVTGDVWSALAVAITARETEPAKREAA